MSPNDKHAIDTSLDILVATDQLRTWIESPASEGDAVDVILAADQRLSALTRESAELKAQLTEVQLVLGTTLLRASELNEPPPRESQDAKGLAGLVFDLVERLRHDSLASSRIAIHKERPSWVARATEAILHEFNAVDNAGRFGAIAGIIRREHGPDDDLVGDLNLTMDDLLRENEELKASLDERLAWNPAGSAAIHRGVGDDRVFRSASSWKERAEQLQRENAELRERLAEAELLARSRGRVADQWIPGGDEYVRQSQERDAACLAKIDAIAPYVQHWQECRALTCMFRFVTGPPVWLGRYCGGVRHSAEHHEFQPDECTCGLDDVRKV